MFASAVAELISLGAIIPFLAVLSNPEQLIEQPYISSLTFLSDLNTDRLVLFATMFFASAAIIASLVRLFNLWLNGQLAAAIGSDLSCEAYRRTLYQPYQVHVQRNSSILISTMTQHIEYTVSALNKILLIFSSYAKVVALFVGLLLVDWQIASLTVSLFGISYGLVAITSRRQLLKNGQRIASSNNLRIQALQEGLGQLETCCSKAASLHI